MKIEIRHLKPIPDKCSEEINQTKLDLLAKKTELELLSKAASKAAGETTTDGNEVYTEWR